MDCFIQKAKSHVKNKFNDILLLQFQTIYINNLNNLTLRNLLQYKFKNYSSRSISAKTPRIKLINEVMDYIQQQIFNDKEIMITFFNHDKISIFEKIKFLVTLRSQNKLNNYILNFATEDIKAYI